jgi:hypothetical protein
MVTMLFCMLLLLLQSQGTSAGIPADVRRELNGKFSGWKLIKLHPYSEKRLRKKGVPNLIRGDFDADGQTDTAAFITHRKSTEFAQSVVILLKRRLGFRAISFESIHTRTDQFLSYDYLVLAKRGARDFDYEANKWFRYPRDSVMLVFDARGSISYIYDGRKFLRIITGD